MEVVHLEKRLVSVSRRQGLWREVIERAGVPETLKPGLSMARREFASCRDQDPEETGFSMRRCLERRHDFQIWRLNSKYWASVGGS